MEKDVKCQLKHHPFRRHENPKWCEPSVSIIFPLSLSTSLSQSFSPLLFLDFCFLFLDLKEKKKTWCWNQSRVILWLQNNKNNNIECLSLSLHYFSLLWLSSFSPSSLSHSLDCKCNLSPGLVVYWFDQRNSLLKLPNAVTLLSGFPSEVTFL